MNSIPNVTTKLLSRLAHALFYLFLVLAWQSVIAAPVSTQFTLGGYINNGMPIKFNLADLQAFAAANPSTQKTVTVSNSSGGADVYTGISLFGFLGYYIKADPNAPKNDILRNYVVATGTDGYKSVFSLGELNSSFGNQNDIIAYQLNGQYLTTDGFARIVAPGDVKAGRWVSNLSSLDVGHVAYTAGLGGVSTQFTVSGQVSAPTTYSIATSTTILPSMTVTVATSPLAGTAFTGFSMWDLLNRSGIITNPSVKNDILG